MYANNARYAIREWKLNNFHRAIWTDVLGFGLHFYIARIVLLLDLFWLINLNRKRECPVATATIITFDWYLWYVRISLRWNHEFLMGTDSEMWKQFKWIQHALHRYCVYLCITFCFALYKFSFGLFTVASSFFSLRISQRVSEKSSSLFMGIMSLFAAASIGRLFAENEK